MVQQKEMMLTFRKYSTIFTIIFVNVEAKLVQHIFYCYNLIMSIYLELLNAFHFGYSFRFSHYGLSGRCIFQPGFKS